MAGERTEQATPQRREKAKREGDLVHSRELCSAAGTLIGVMLLGVAAPKFLNAWFTALGGFLGFGMAAHWEPDSIDATLHSLLGLAMAVLAPVGLVMAGVATAALAAGVLQTGGVQVHPQVLGLKFDRINPLSNLKNLFSLRSMARLGKSMIPAALLAVFSVHRVARQWAIPPFSSVRLVSLGGDVYALLLATAWLLFGWALIDYVVEWRSREQRLKMSRQEMREEHKDSEGNPQIRGRIRNLQRQARRRRMKTDVSRAAVVVTNPTHYAVALDFNFETMDAPKVLAKGRNLLAEEIKDQARWAGVPILENPPLARSLYRAVEAGDAIPLELYAAVASILAFLYRQRVEQEMRVRRERTGARTPAPPKAGEPSPGATIPGLGIARGKRFSERKLSSVGDTDMPLRGGQ
ncbi:EscU/YscU/HrcU family type III secretion system export apparatus switch protein [Acidicapsa ligni]|uniref:EscU/YscU/HrcU family type III secretion system export apparatus switch protein n=1 Tax=Acidicapsa ligni TaxID=542300 RepID=UPI0021E0E30C|nr:EscU/YscU/HrcU family type III secretion system export apparatus switch protein [Acidicapsa ligni]